MPADWERPFEALAQECGLETSLVDAFLFVQGYVSDFPLMQSVSRGFHLRPSCSLPSHAQSAGRTLLGALILCVTASHTSLNATCRPERSVQAATTWVAIYPKRGLQENPTISVQLGDELGRPANSVEA